MRAHALATILPRDALNVFITLSARALNPELSIVARGELASTENKLLQAGADKVVLPTHIGAERIAELLLHAESARFIEGLERSHAWPLNRERRNAQRETRPILRQGIGSSASKIYYFYISSGRTARSDGL
jgi:voltage-gated potassium channel